MRRLQLPRWLHLAQRHRRLLVLQRPLPRRQHLLWPRHLRLRRVPMHAALHWPDLLVRLVVHVPAQLLRPRNVRRLRRQDLQVRLGIHRRAAAAARELCGSRARVPARSW
eukprot:Amastigsp_a510961_115.p8 type:complete len:110 gc:universal Amastigsp_a510961_115:1066-737(-)